MKKIVAFLLTFSMISTLFSMNVSAVNVNQEIENERQFLHDSIQEQLVAQDALYLMEHFDALIDDMLLGKYNSGIVPYAQASSWYAPNGGVICGTGTYIQVEARFYNVEQTQELYDKRNEFSELEAIMTFLASGIPYVGFVISSSALANALYKNAIWKQIKVGECGCYTYSVYDTLEMRTTNIIINWTPPYMSLGSTITVTDYYVKPY